MATATVEITAASSSSSSAPTASADDLPLQLDSIPLVDLNLLSQSELYSLSLCSSSTFDPRRCDDVVNPKIDRSVFNESAGSRKQTYSRLRLAPASSAASPSSIRRRTPHLRSANHNLPPYLETDPEKAESRQIVALLKQLFGVDTGIGVSEDKTEELVPVRVDYSDSVPQFANVVFAGSDSVPQLANVVFAGSGSVPQLANVVSTGQKRKRGRPRKNENAVRLVENKVESHAVNDAVMVRNEIVSYEDVGERDKEIVNRNGVEVDMVQFGLMEDPYGEELRRRTEGMGSEEELLEFLKRLNGQWGSRRKKKRIVDASEFGNVLPKGWRLMLSCKKKEGRVWLFCRRYIRFLDFSNVTPFSL